MSYDVILKARDVNRLTGRELISLISTKFIELHGDRLYGDDRAIVGGIAKINGEYVTIIAQDKGKDIDEKMSKNFGMAHPEGFRKAKRLVKQAEKFNRPVILIMDTAGAYPGIGAEERGQGNAIAEMLYELSTLKVPVISILLSEGGSGGALAFGVCDHLYMFENAFYSVISPEGYASILYRGERQVSDVIDEMKILSPNLKDLSIVDEILIEPKDGLNKDSYEYLSIDLKEKIKEKIKELSGKNKSDLLDDRYERFRKFGRYE